MAFSALAAFFLWSKKPVNASCPWTPGTGTGTGAGARALVHSHCRKTGWHGLIMPNMQVHGDIVTLASSVPQV